MNSNIEPQETTGTEQTPPKKRQVLHITAGNDDWNPTVQDMDTLCKMFAHAVVDPAGCVVVTRSGVQAKLIEVQEGDSLTIVSAHVETPDEVVAHVVVSPSA